MDTETAKSLKFGDRVKYVDNSGGVIGGKVELIDTEKVRFLWDNGDRDLFKFDGRLDLSDSSISHIGSRSRALSQIRRASETL